MSHLTEKNGRKTLYCFYDPALDNYDEVLDAATKKHNLEGERFNAICRPFKKERTAKEKIQAIYRQLKTMREEIEGQNREPTHAECILANDKLAKVELLEKELLHE